MAQAQGSLTRKLLQPFTNELRCISETRCEAAALALESCMSLGPQTAKCVLGCVITNCLSTVALLVPIFRLERKQGEINLF